MTNHYAKLIRISLIFGVTGFFVFAGISFLAWKVYPYHRSDDDLMRQMRWTAHVVGEKVGGLALLSIMAFIAARLNRPTWKIGVSTAVATAVIYQLIGVIVYLVRFGFSAYQTYNSFFLTFIYSIALACLFGFLAVWKQYRHEKIAT